MRHEDDGLGPGVLGRARDVLRYIYPDWSSNERKAFIKKWGAVAVITVGGAAIAALFGYQTTQ